MSEMMMDNQQPSIRAVLPWFGGKRTLARTIADELGPHRQYFEPFCGSMAVLLAKAPSQKETVNDLHGDLIGLARTIADPEAAPKLYDMLQRAVVSEGLLLEGRAILEAGEPQRQGPVTPSMLERAYWYFLVSWIGRNGTSGTARVEYQIAVRWSDTGGSPTVRFKNAVGSLPAWHRRLQNVVILSRDAFSILPRFQDSPRTAIYVDPPYVRDTGNRTHMKSGATSRYRHEFSNGGGPLIDAADDHVRLRDILAKFRRARVVVSYYDCPRVRELYEGWTIVEHTRTKFLAATARGGAQHKEAPELLIINGPSRAGD